ncbi:glycoside hydrolase domain-containing protein [Actinomadura opuntiae]|uniref:glycoside hydrolase domain-containing protein n=1 Tax=Actinomadura sp. OS1-43 TaxID=604315 RepID=UPI00255B0240|nr:glycoside hydrolase domain-containing protein [Actinomadura sp. OS1-43]MDL4812829.1 DUF1906 domain-containing protein [Actinomadura sp. OS1-43]
MTVFGVDYAWGRPGVSALKRAGVKFACRYLSHDTTGKNLTRAEAEELSDAGIWLVVVWETAANRALSGRSGGVADARDAAAQAKACGMPGDRPIYFAVDWDASASQQAKINAYLEGAASVLGRGRVGLYAGYGPVKRAFDAKKIAYGWQTYAWSNGRWDSRAQLQQYSNDRRINGVGLDYDRAVKDDFGQWRVGVTPAATDQQEDDDMPEYVSLGLSKPVALKAGAKTRIGFDKEYADWGKAHADPGAYPGILSGGKAPGTSFSLSVNITDGVKWRLIETDPDKKYATSKTYETRVGSGTVTGRVNTKQHLYVEVEPDKDVTVNVAVRALYWRAR